MTDRIVTHRAIRPSDGKVIFTATMISRAMWMPFADAVVNSLHDWQDDLIFQTRAERPRAVWHPAIVMVRLRQVVITTMDAFSPAESEEVSSG
jgi:hypothetical protein